MESVYMTVDVVDFKFTFHSVGWSYVEVKIKVKTKFLGLIPYWKCLWATSKGFEWGPALAENVEKAHKHEINRWCKKALKEYLSYAKSWSK